MNESEKLTLCQNPLDSKKPEPLWLQGCEEAFAVPALLPWRLPPVQVRALSISLVALVLPVL